MEEQVLLSPIVHTFGYNLLQGICSAFNCTDNVLISALSIHIALLMTLNGAKGSTLEQMRNTLLINSSSLIQVNRAARHFYEKLVQYQDLSIANALFIHKRLPVKESFLSITKETFHSESQLLDFSDSEVSCQTIP